MWHQRVDRASVIIVILGVLFVSGVRGQHSSHLELESPRVSHVFVEKWTTADGLPVNHVQEIVQTPDGYLWIATGGGLVRFDGIEFRTFDRDDIPRWTTSYVKELYQGIGNDLWLISEAGELACRCDGRIRGWSHVRAQRVYPLQNQEIWIEIESGLAQARSDSLLIYTVDDGLPASEIEDVYLDSSGRTWIGTETGLARWVKDAGVPFEQIQALTSTAVHRIYETQRGDIRLVTEEGLLTFRDDTLSQVASRNSSLGSVEATYVDDRDVAWISTGTEITSLSAAGRREYDLDDKPGEVRGWASGPTGVTWIGHTNGLYRVGGGELREVTLDRERIDHISTVYGDRKSNIWIGGRTTGLLRVASEGEAPEKVREARHVSAVHTVFEDAEGNVWIGSNSGLLRVSERKFDVYTADLGGTRDFVFPVHGDENGGIWWGTWGNGLHELRDGKLISYGLKAGLASNKIRALEVTEAGAVWVGAERAVTNLSTGETHPIEGGGWIRALHQTNDGTLWAGGNRFLRSLTEDGWRKEASRLPPDGEVWAIHEDSAGRLWIGTKSGLHLRKDGSWHTFTMADGLSSNFVVSIYEDNSGRLWFGTRGGGLNRYSEGRFTRYMSSDGLHDNGIWGILEDDQGRYWMSSNTGLFWVDKTDLDAFANGRIDRFRPTVYNETDGLPSSEFNCGDPAAWKGRRGRLWFPSLDGVVVVDPDEIPTNERPPPIEIQRVAVDGRVVETENARSLSPSVENLEFQFAALSLVAPTENTYRYQLEGYDDGWRDAGNRRNAFYTNLPPGEYTFRVQGANNDGVWNEAGAAFTFRLRPFFYETWWVRLFGVVFVIVALGAGYRYRVRYLHEQELERQVARRTYELQTEKAKTEAQAKALKDQAAQLEEMDRRKSRFFANISHEFRTPLSMILSPISSVLDGGSELDEKVRERLRTALRNGRRLERLVDQLFELATLDTSGQTMDTERFDLVHIVERSVRPFVLAAEREEVDLQLQSEFDQREISGDVEKIQTVIRNLLSNALKYTPEGGSVRVAVRDNPSEVTLCVRDTGVGIPEKEQLRIFDRFYRADDADRQADHGMGVGLALVKEYVQLHGGSVEVDSEPGFGTEFIVHLPTCPQTTDATDSEAEVKAESSGTSESGSLEDGVLRRPADDVVHNQSRANSSSRDAAPTVLLVEDNADVRTFLRSELGGLYHVVEAESADTALARLDDFDPDVVVSDVRMPNMDGLEFCREVRQSEYGQELPILLLTARAGLRNEVKGLEAGADDYLEKPFEIDVLEARIERLIQTREALRDKYCDELIVEPTGVSVSSDEEAFLERAQEAVESHIDNLHFTVEAFAAEVGYSKSQLTRKLKAACGYTPASYVRELRLQRAAQLLEQGVTSISRVARRVGYEDAEHFSTLFRERFDAPPSQYPGE